MKYDNRQVTLPLRVVDALADYLTDVRCALQDSEGRPELIHYAIDLAKLAEDTLKGVRTDE